MRRGFWTCPPKTVSSKSDVVPLVWGMILDVFSDKFADVTLFCLGPWTENDVRVLIKLLAGVH